MPRSRSVMVTVACSTAAPLASFTVPMMLPETACPAEISQKTKNKTIARTKCREIGRIVIPLWAQNVRLSERREKILRELLLGLSKSSSKVADAGRMPQQFGDLVAGLARPCKSHVNATRPRFQVLAPTCRDHNVLASL